MQGLIKINTFSPLLNIQSLKKLMVLLINPLVETLIKKKASQLWGRVMGNLIFKPISRKMQPPIYSANMVNSKHY